MYGNRVEMVRIRCGNCEKEFSREKKDTMFDPTSGKKSSWCSRSCAASRKGESKVVMNYWSKVKLVK